jgi:tetratricopeptide (TPR) repeat protein
VSDETQRSRYEIYRAAKSHEAQGRYEEALKAYAEAIDMSADYAHAWYYKSRLHYKLQQYEDALCCAEKALELEPSWERHVRTIIDECKSKCK